MNEKDNETTNTTKSNTARNSLGDEEKAKFDALMELTKFWWERFEFRVNKSWRIAFSLWSILAIYAGSIMTGGMKLETVKFRIFSIIFGTVLVDAAYSLDGKIIDCQ